MLRPFYLDLFDVLLPLFAGVAALAVGGCLHRLPSMTFRGAIGLMVTVVLFLGVSYFTPMHRSVSDALWYVGGITTVACMAAMFLLGVVWTSRGRSTSAGFLGSLAGLVTLILALNSGGRLWWRCVTDAPWGNAPDAAGCLTQTTGWTCSPAAATMLLHHYGVATTEGEMAYLANTAFLGTDVQSIAWAMTMKGQPHRLVAHVADADYAACLQQPGPFLACVHVPRLGSHAVLVLRARAEEVELIDPRFGQRQKLARDAIELQWEGRIVYLKAAE